jgi:hypothetical protein
MKINNVTSLVKNFPETKIKTQISPKITRFMGRDHARASKNKILKKNSNGKIIDLGAHARGL